MGLRGLRGKMGREEEGGRGGLEFGKRLYYCNMFVVF